MPRKSILVILLLLLSTPGMALTISFASTGASTDSDILVYNVTGSDVLLVGQYNTSTKGLSLDANASYMFVMQPSSSLDLSQPDTAADALFNNNNGMITRNWRGIIVFAMVIGLIVFLYVLASKGGKAKRWH